MTSFLNWEKNHTVVPGRHGLTTDGVKFQLPEILFEVDGEKFHLEENVRIGKVISAIIQ